MVDGATAGERIRAIRQRLGLSQVELAARLGVSNVSVNRWERGKSRPDARVLERLDLMARAGTDLVRAAAIRAPGNLPATEHAPIGRDGDLAELEALLATRRVVTLTGTGGVGKTTLALALGRRLADRFPDGVWFVDLAPVTGAAAVEAACLRALGLRGGGRQAPRDRLAEHLRERTALVILDNCEQVLAASSDLAGAIVREAGASRVVATSREPLRVPGEAIYPVRPLPDDAATALLLERMRERRGRAEVDEAERHAARELSARLDGLPLAIELAAARTHVLSPGQILERLDRRFEVLGSRGDLPARQRSLRATLEWSYDLLDPVEAALFRTLGIFRGWFDLTAVEAVGGGAGTIDLLDRLGSRSLIVVDHAAPGRPRYRLLDSLADYARDRLREAGEMGTVTERHRAYYGDRARAAGTALQGPEQVARLAELDAAYENVEAALGAAVSGGDATEAIEIGAALATYWARRGRFAEGIAWLERALALPSGAPDGVRGRGFARLGLLRVSLGDWAAERDLDEAAAIAASTGDRALTALAEEHRGLLHRGRGELERAAAAHERALAIREALGDRPGRAASTMNLGLIALVRGDHVAAERMLTAAWSLLQGSGDLAAEAAVLANLGDLAARDRRFRDALGYLDRAAAAVRRLGDPERLAILVGNAAEVRLMVGDAAGALTGAGEATEQFRRTGNRTQLAGALYIRGLAAARVGRRSAGLADLREALALYRDLDDFGDAALTIEAIAGLFVEAGQAERAARWLGGAAALRERVGIEPYALFDYAGTVARARAALGAETADALWAAGRALPGPELVAEALLHGTVEDIDPVAPRDQASPDVTLTERQSEILRLVAAGASNREIARDLGISARTVERHLSTIFVLLDTDSRAAAAALAIGRGLIPAAGA